MCVKGENHGFLRNQKVSYFLKLFFLKVTKLHWKKILEMIKQMKRWRGHIQKMKCLLREALEELRV